MDLRDARPGDAIELPEGVYSLVAITHCRAAAMDWSVWDLEADAAEGAVPAGDSPAPPTPPPVAATPSPTLTLALIDGQPYRAQVTAVEALPDEDEVTVNHMIFRLRHRGEARAERSGTDGQRDFWLGQYRRYDREGKLMIFMEQYDQVTRLLADPMDEHLVAVFQ